VVKEQAGCTLSEGSAMMQVRWLSWITNQIEVLVCTLWNQEY
jgi:hypothetical protein